MQPTHKQPPASSLHDLPLLFTVQESHSFTDQTAGLSNCDRPLAHARLTFADLFTTTEALTRNDYLNVSALQLGHCAAIGFCSNLFYE